MGGRFLRFRLDIMQFHAYLQGLPPNPMFPACWRRPCHAVTMVIENSLIGGGGRGKGIWSIQHPLWSKRGSVFEHPLYTPIRC